MDGEHIDQHDSALGRWIRVLHRPAPPLDKYVAMLWYVTGHTNYMQDRRLPEGQANLLFNLGTPPRLLAREASGAARDFATCWIAGQQTRYIETASSGASALAGVQFRSFGAYRLLGIAQHELIDQVIELEAVCGDRILGLRQRLLEAATPRHCFALLEAWLMRLYQRGSAVHASVLGASRLLHDATTAPRVEQLGRLLDVSQGYLLRRFREQVGLAPKAYAGILRFNAALGMARAQSRSWSDIAASCGYYDHAHLVRDFQRYSGQAPSQLIARAQPDAGSVVIE